MKRNRKLNIELVLAVFMTIFGVILIALSFIVPPKGVIDPTVLTAYGETLTFVGALVGVDYHYQYKRPPNRAENAENEPAND